MESRPNHEPRAPLFDKFRMSRPSPAGAPAVDNCLDKVESIM